MELDVTAFFPGQDQLWVASIDAAPALVPIAEIQIAPSTPLLLLTPDYARDR